MLRWVRLLVPAAIIGTLALGGGSGFAADARYECRAVRDLAEVVLTSPRLAVNVFYDPINRKCAFWVSLGPASQQSAQTDVEKAIQAFSQVTAVRGQQTDVIFATAQKLDMRPVIRAVLLPFEYEPYSKDPATAAYQKALLSSEKRIVQCLAEVVAGKSGPPREVFRDADISVSCGVSGPDGGMTIIAQHGEQSITLLLPA